MMENKEIEVLHKINKQVSEIMINLNSLVKDLSELTNIVFDKTIDSLDDEIKLHSHMVV